MLAGLAMGRNFCLLGVRLFGGSALLASLAAALTACGGGGGGGGSGQTPTTPVAPPPPPPPPPPVFSLVVDAAPEPVVGIVGESPARASLAFRYTVDQTGQDDRMWSIPDVSLCEASESGGEQCSTVTAAPASGTVAADTPVTVALSLTCERALTWAAPVEIVLGDDDARATVAWEVECEIPPFDGELIGVEIYQGVFTRAWSRETGEWTWRVPPRISWDMRPPGESLPAGYALTAPMVEVAGRPTLIVARVEHGYPDSYGGLALSVENADGSTAYEAVAGEADRAVVLAPGDAPAEHIDVRPPGVPERQPDNARYESEFRLEVPGSVPPEDLTGQPLHPGAWRPGRTLVLTLDPDGEAVRTSFAIDAEHEVSPYVSDVFPSWSDSHRERFPKIRSPFEPDEPERLVLVRIEAESEGSVWLPAPPAITPSAARQVLSGLLALMPVGDYSVEIVPEPLRVEAARSDPAFGGGELWNVLTALSHFKSAHHNPHDFVLGLYAAGEDDYGGVAFRTAPARDHETVSRSAWPANLNSVSVSPIQRPQTVAHEVGHNLSLGHAPGCDPIVPDPSWPDGIAYWNGSPGPVRFWWRIGEWVANFGEFNTPRTSEADSGTDTGIDVMGRCAGNPAISDWYYHRASLFRMSAEGWLDWPADEAAAALQVGGAQSVAPTARPAGAEASLTAAGPSVVVTGAVDADGGWSVSHTDHSERPPTRSAGSYRLAAFGPDGALVGEVSFEPAPVSHSDSRVWSVRVAYGGETPVRLAVVGPDGSTVLDWAESAL